VIDRRGTPSSITRAVYALSSAARRGTRTAGRPTQTPVATPAKTATPPRHGTAHPVSFRGPWRSVTSQRRKSLMHDGVNVHLTTRAAAPIRNACIFTYPRWAAPAFAAASAIA
jgi:hypothetical protein